MHAKLKRTFVCIGIIWLYVIVGAFYINPINSLAKPDEAQHLIYVYDVQQGVVFPRAPTPQPYAIDERCQPPLYYWLSAFVSAPSAMPSPQSWADVNPFFLRGIPYENGNGFVMLPQFFAPVFALRWWSLLLGVVTICATYRLARLFTASTLSMLIAATAASLPSVIFAQSGVSNIALAAPLSALALYELARMWKLCVFDSRKWLLLIWLVCAIWTRLELGILLLLLLFVWLKIAFRNHLIYAYAKFSVLIGIALAPLAIRNLAQYGDIMAQSCIPSRASAATLASWWTNESSPTFKAVFATFGEGYIFAPEWVYTAIKIALALGAAGWLFALLRWMRQPARQWRLDSALWLLLIHATLIVGVAVVGNLTRVVGSPRYIGSYGVSWITLWILGLAHAADAIRSKQMTQRIVALIGGGALLLLNGYCIARVILPTYQPPPIAAQFTQTPIAQMGEGILLRKAEIERTNSDAIKVTLYWQATRPPSRNYAVFIHASDALGNPPVRQTDGYSIHGNYPTAWWRNDQIIKDEFTLTALPARALVISAGLYHPPTMQRLEAFDASGARLRDDLVQIGLVN